MNRVILMGRLTRDPEIRYAQNEDHTAIGRYTLAVDRRGDGADFISCVAFGKSAEFAEKYFHKGMKIVIEGRIQTGSYTNDAGDKVYTVDVIVDNQEFCEKKGTSHETPDDVLLQGQSKPKEKDDEFVNVPDGIDEELPFA